MLLFCLQLSADHTILKLGDFGLARATEGTRQYKTMIGSYRYMAPEVMIQSKTPGKVMSQYSRKADVYSFGGFFEMSKLMRICSSDWFQTEL